MPFSFFHYYFFLVNIPLKFNNNVRSVGIRDDHTSVVYDHGQFNNSLPSQIPTKKFLERHILRELDFHFNIVAG